MSGLIAKKSAEIQIDPELRSGSKAKHWAYLALGLFCVLATIRDVFSEGIFKSGDHPLDPVAILFLYSLMTVVTSLSAVQFRRGRPFRVLKFIWQKKSLLRDAIAASFFTGISFLAYFAAIQTQLGAGLGAFADFSVTPFAAAIFASLLLNERLSSAFFGALIPCVLGMLFLLGPRTTELSADSWKEWALGFGYTLLSAISGSAYRVFTKRLLNHRLDRALIIAIRFLISVPVLGLILWFRERSTPWQMAPWVLGLAPGIFTLPMYLATFALQRLPVNQYSLLMFALPVVTYLGSALWNHSPLYLTDLFGTILILGGILYYERRRV